MLTFILLLSLSLFIGLTVFAPVLAGVVLLFAATFETVLVEITGFTFSIANLSKVTFLVGALIRWWVTKERVDWDAAIPALVISAVVLLSVPFSFSPVPSFFSAVVFIANAFTFYFVFWFIKTCRFDSITQSIVPILIFLLLIVSIFQFLLFNTVQPYRIHAGFQNWNICAVILVGFLPFLLIPFKPLKLDFRLFYSTALLLLLVIMIIGTRSRSGVILFILAMGIVMLHGLFDRKVAFILAASAVVGFVSFIILQITGVYDITGLLQSIINSPRVQERSQNALLAFMTLAKHPLTGMGIGQWEMYGTWAYQDVSFSIKHEYSSFMVLLAETGLFGGFASIFFMQCLFPKNTATDQDKNFALLSAVQSSLWIWISASFLYSIHLHDFFWVWLGFLAGTSYIEYEPSTPPSLQDTNR